MPRLKRILLYASIPLNAISAGGIFCFPLFSPSLALHLKLSQSQLSTIVLAGMMGQYPFAMLVGMFIDRVGPWACSLLAGILFSTGFGAFSALISGPNDGISKVQYSLLVLFFFMAGLGTVASYFSCLFAASKTFPARTGLATGVITAAFGLSPLFLSSMGTLFFPDAVDGLDAPHYLLFLALFAGLINLFGAFGLREVPRTTIKTEEAVVVREDRAGDEQVVDEVTERQPLLPKKPSPEVVPHDHEKLLSLLKDKDFLLLAWLLLCCLGMSEMVISNIGTIVASLAPFAHEKSTVTAASQVRLLSLANTFSRLLTGPISDFTSPVPMRHESGERHFHPKRAVSRVAFVWLTSLMMLIACVWMSVGVMSVNGIWVLSILIGAAYGMMWTVVPSIVESVWGSSHAARNFGTISYAPFIGTPIFTFIYATMSDKARSREGHDQDPMCRGSECWRSTFTICSFVLILNVALSTVLWRRWRKVV